jgi:hypothetical protein
MELDAKQARRVRGGERLRASQLERDRDGRNRAYGVPEFLVRWAELRRLAHGEGRSGAWPRRD